MTEEKAVLKQIYTGLASLLRLSAVLLIIIGMILLLRIIVLFFGSLSELPGYKELLKVSDLFLGPANAVKAINTPYNGVFDLPATIVLVLVMVAELILSSLQHFFTKKARQLAKAAGKVKASEND